MREVSRLLLLIAISARVLFAQEQVDISVIERIKREALQNSQVMEHAFFLSDVYGPRLIGRSRDIPTWTFTTACSRKT
jgi:carboxypeptidase Q